MSLPLNSEAYRYLSTLDAKQAVLVILALPLLYILASYLYILHVIPNSHYLRYMPGPKRPANWITGDFGTVLAGEPGVVIGEWMESYGKVFKFWRNFGNTNIVLGDPTALQYVLMNAYDFPKPDGLREELTDLTGVGLLFAEGEQHRNQRRIMNPAFSVAHLKELFPIFLNAGSQLSAKWKAAIESDSSFVVPDRVDQSGKVVKSSNQTSDGEKTDGIVLDVLNWFGRATLDVIGLAGFGYDLRALEEAKTDLATSFASVFAGEGAAEPSFVMLAIGAILGKFPILKKLPLKRIRVIKENLKVMQRECRKILQVKKREVLDLMKEEGAESNKGQKDLIALLLRANLLPTEKRRLSDDEVIGQMTTFMAAGHETSSVTLAWAIRRLALDHDVQDKLRSEARDAMVKVTQAGNTDIGFDELNELPYLDAFVKEVMRLDAAVNATGRTTSHDSVIPLGQPIVLDNGKSVDRLEIKRGQNLYLPIKPLHRSKELWGEDALEFRPERWLDGVPAKVEEQIKGASVWAHLMTFIGGPRACIGYRFAVMEIKAILFALLRDFEFEDLGLPIVGRIFIVTRPTVKGLVDPKAMLPVRVSLAS